MDLVSTVGEIAALGASGVVMWGSSSDYNTKVNTISDWLIYFQTLQKGF